MSTASHLWLYSRTLPSILLHRWFQCPMVVNLWMLSVLPCCIVADAWSSAYWHFLPFCRLCWLARNVRHPLSSTSTFRSTEFEVLSPVWFSSLSTLQFTQFCSFFSLVSQAFTWERSSTHNRPFTTRFVKSSRISLVWMLSRVSHFVMSHDTLAHFCRRTFILSMLIWWTYCTTRITTSLPWATCLLLVAWLIKLARFESAHLLAFSLFRHTSNISCKGIRASVEIRRFYVPMQAAETCCTWTVSSTYLSWSFSDSFCVHV